MSYGGVVSKKVYYSRLWLVNVGVVAMVVVM